jgi:acetyl/propionyl-CoA carboxylase alpha subunit
MKMEHTLAAPHDAVIASVEAVAGEQVVEGAPIVTFQSKDGQKEEKKK